MKTRLDEKTMRPISDAKVGVHPKSELEKLVSLHDPGWCGSCFGGLPPDSGCCQTCDEVRKSYVDRGWAFNDPDSIDQVREPIYSTRPLSTKPPHHSAYRSIGRTSCKSKPTRGATSLVPSN